MRATGIQSAGFNRTSTLQVERRDKDGAVMYEVCVAGYGMRGPWLETTKGWSTLARALRHLQERCEAVERLYRSSVFAMQSARTKKGEQKA